MKQRLFVTLSLAGLAMATFGATKPKTAIKSLNKTTIQQPTYTEWQMEDHESAWHLGDERIR